MELDPDNTPVTLFFILLIFSGLLSASESAFFSINKLIMKRLQGEERRSARRVLRLLQHPRRLLISVLIGNTLVNVSAASLAALYILKLGDSYGWPESLVVAINIILVTFLILVFAEVIPKVTAVRDPRRAAERLSLFAEAVYYLFLPLAFLFDKLISRLLQFVRFKEPPHEKYLDVDEFQALLEIGEEEGAIEEEEREMLHSVFTFGDTSVREIMIPRTEVVCVPADISFPELLELIKENGHTRMPVYEGTIDKIKGILNIKDLLPLMAQPPSTFYVLNHIREAIFVPESKKIDDLLRLFQKKSQHMAIVVDEYGGTSGIVTLEDIIEELVGEIHDEYDDEPPLLREVEPGVYLVNAKIDIDTLNESVPIDVPESEAYDTLGGFILEMTGTLPQPNDTLIYGRFVLTIEKVEQNRIVLVRLQQQTTDEKVE